jgi:hypothetical protein
MVVVAVAMLVAIMGLIGFMSVRAFASGEPDRRMPTEQIALTDEGVRVSKMELDGHTFYVFIRLGFRESSMAVVEVDR